MFAHINQSEITVIGFEVNQILIQLMKSTKEYGNGRRYVMFERVSMPTNYLNK